ncbi:MAG TPA: multicopper oxidase domain-containing protein [Ktedonobacterales bacterium]|nr:multicopper oxidase domain-containing protein [Ktedonobacterales bacterium]
MSKVLEEHASVPATPATASETTRLTPETFPPAKRRPNIYWQPKSGDVPALSVLVGLVGIALIILTLVIALVGRGAASTGGGTMVMPSSSNAQTYPVNPSKVPAHQTYDATAPATPSGDTVNVKLTVKEVTIAIAPNVAYHAWTFNGTVPGPVIRVRQGQTINFTLENQGSMAHSIDFHAAQTPWSVNYQPVLAGKSFSFTWKANYPGVFLYHCGTPPVMFHMANGMYGAIIVDPANGWAPAQEYVLVQSEFYTRQASDGTYSIDSTKLMAGQPDYVTFNGFANQYVKAPLTAKPGQKIRLFIVNAGPSRFSAFHVIGALFSDVYLDGNPANHTVGDQTLTIPPGGAAVVELTIPDAGKYPFVTHSFMDASIGATGVISVAP